MKLHSQQQLSYHRSVCEQAAVGKASRANYDRAFDTLVVWRTAVGLATTSSAEALEMQALKYLD